MQQNNNNNPDMSFDPFTLDQLLNSTLAAAAYDDDDDDDDVSIEREIARREQSGERRDVNYPPGQMRTHLNPNFVSGNQDDRIIHSLQLAVGDRDASASNGASNDARNGSTVASGPGADLSMEPTPLGPSTCRNIVPSLGYQASNPNLLSYLRLFASDRDGRSHSLLNGQPCSISTPQTLSRGVDGLKSDSAASAPKMPIPTSVLSTHQDPSMTMAATTASPRDANSISREQGPWQSSYTASSAQTCHNENLGGAIMAPPVSYDFNDHFPPFYGVEGDDIPQDRHQDFASAVSDPNIQQAPIHAYIDAGAQRRFNEVISPSRKRSSLSSTSCALTGWTDDNRFRASHVEKWQQRYQEMARFKEQFGHCLVPLEHCENEPLAHWVKRQRCQYKIKMSAAAKGKPDTSTLTEERKRLLDDLGFIWDAHKGSWETRLAQVEEFVRLNGHCRIPSRYPTNQSLAIWVKCQRRQYKLFQRSEKCNVNQERVDALTRLGFVWEPRRKAAEQITSTALEVVRSHNH